MNTMINGDAHACLPQHPLADFTPVRRLHAAGVNYVSLNVGADMNPLWRCTRSRWCSATLIRTRWCSTAATSPTSRYAPVPDRLPLLEAVLARRLFGFQLDPLATDIQLLEARRGQRELALAQFLDQRLAGGVVVA